MLQLWVSSRICLFEPLDILRQVTGLQTLSVVVVIILIDESAVTRVCSVPVTRPTQAVVLIPSLPASQAKKHLTPSCHVVLGNFWDLPLPASRKPQKPGSG